MMCDLLEETISPTIGNTVMSGGRNILKMIELQIRGRMPGPKGEIKNLKFRK